MAVSWVTIMVGSPSTDAPSRANCSAVIRKIVVALWALAEAGTDGETLTFSQATRATNDGEKIVVNLSRNNGSAIVDGEGTLQVVDMMGRVVVCRDASNASAISTSGMAPGVYVLRLINGDNVKTQKIVIR